MLDDQTLRERHAETRESLARLDQERPIMAELLSYYERLMGARGLSPAATPPSGRRAPVVSAPATRRAGAGISPTSVRGRTLAVLREAKGQPMHTRDIAARLRERGVSLGGKDKTSVVDLALLSLSRRTGFPLRKVAPRTWVLDPEKGAQPR